VGQHKHLHHGAFRKGMYHGPGIDQFEELRATKPRQARKIRRRRNAAVEKFF
jgi:hypothetical protein